jgi:hypothetical protein
MVEEYYQQFKNKTLYFMIGQKLVFYTVMARSILAIGRTLLVIKANNYFLEEAEMLNNYFVI